MPQLSRWLNGKQGKLGSLPDLKNRSEVGQAGKPRGGGSQNSAGRGQILTMKFHFATSHPPLLVSYAAVQLTAPLYAVASTTTPNTMRYQAKTTKV